MMNTSRSLQTKPQDTHTFNTPKMDPNHYVM